MGECARDEPEGDGAEEGRPGSEQLMEKARLKKRL